MSSHCAFLVTLPGLKPFLLKSKYFLIPSIIQDKELWYAVVLLTNSLTRENNSFL